MYRSEFLQEEVIDRVSMKTYHVHVESFNSSVNLRCQKQISLQIYTPITTIIRLLVSPITIHIQ